MANPAPKKKEEIADVARNRKAWHDYEVLDTYEAGIVLSGTEVKAIRAGKINLMDCYAQANRAGELWVHNMHISEFAQGNRNNHNPYNTRKLLMHAHEIAYLVKESTQKHLTIVPLRVYFKRQFVKVELGLCKGRKDHDKRHAIADKDNKKRLANVMKISRQ